MSLHALLATHLALDESPEFVAPNAVFPALASFDAMPFAWPPKLRALLPQAAMDLVKKQHQKFKRDWGRVSTMLVRRQRDRDDYLHAWMLVNTRSFYYETPQMQHLPHDDRLLLLPVADLFNHANSGCESTFSSQSYAITATRDYRAGEEVHFCYGSHSNDFLLAEYGFVPAQNQHDVVCLDEVIVSRLSLEQKHFLRGKEYLGNYMLNEDGDECSRTKVVLRVLTCPQEKWERFAESGDDEPSIESDARALLVRFLNSFSDVIKRTLETIHSLDTGQQGQIALLTTRWKQIHAVVVKAKAKLDS